MMEEEKINQLAGLIIIGSDPEAVCNVVKEEAQKELIEKIKAFKEILNDAEFNCLCVEGLNETFDNIFKKHMKKIKK